MPGARYSWPLLPRPAVGNLFRAPSFRYGTGHRGADLVGAADQAVLAARADGRYQEPAVRAILAAIDAEEIAVRTIRGITRNRRQNRASNIVLHDGGHNQPRLPTVEAVDQLLTRLAVSAPETTYVTPDAWLPSN